MTVWRAGGPAPAVLCWLGGPGSSGTARAFLPALPVVWTQENPAVPGGTLKAFRALQPSLNNSLSSLNSQRGPQNRSHREPLLPTGSMVLTSLTKVDLG